MFCDNSRNGQTTTMTHPRPPATAAGRRKRMTKKEWEPKTSDCFLVTGGQLKRLRDESDYDKRREMLYPMAHQRYITEIGKENEKFASDKQQSKLDSTKGGEHR